MARRSSARAWGRIAAFLLLLGVIAWQKLHHHGSHDQQTVIERSK
jgi:hypothetical protein